jgi:thiopurine S-methyltransferase
VEPQFWRERWARREIGFHRPEVNPALQRHFDVLRGRSRVLVPLCGQSLDLFWLRSQGLEVVGVELVESAVAGLFTDAGVTPEVTVVPGAGDEPAFHVYRGDGVTVWVGDWFAATPALLGRFDAVWDRAALIAVGPERFERYVATARGLLADGAVTLLCTLTRPDETGPPWSVPDALVRRLFADAAVEPLHESDDPGRPGWRELVFRVGG